MSLRSTANVTFASEPSALEKETHKLPKDRYHVGFMADRNYFEDHPKMNYAIRCARFEFDWVCNPGDCPPPLLYVLTKKISASEHEVIPLFRGTPFWLEFRCHDVWFADCDNDKQAIELMERCREMGGMDKIAREQFNKHLQFVTQMRASNSREWKVN